MFDNFDALLIDDVEDGANTYFDEYNMRIDSAMESFMSTTICAESDIEMLYAAESVLDAIDTDLVAIAMEAEAGGEKKTFKEKIKNGLVRVVNALLNICKSGYNISKRKGKDGGRMGQWWYKKIMTLTRLRNRLEGIKDAKELANLQPVVNKEKEEVTKAVEAEKNNASSTSSSSSNKKWSEMTEMEKWHERKNETKGQYKESNFKISNKREIEANIPNIEKRVRALQYKENNGTISGAERVRLRQLENKLDKYNKVANSSKPNNGSGNRRDHDIIQSFHTEESYMLTDYDYGYEVAIEGLFSKPKTAEALLTKMQKKVSKLKTIGQCDDMLRQLDAESSKFNSAISSLKNATNEFSQTNDKKALRKAAGPVLKELNKTCKILKIKNIASDPKNISQDEITKLHDFIKGAKQLIKAKKQSLSGGGATTESFSYLDSYDDFDVLDIMQGEDDYDIAEESLTEDFDEATEMIAVATEGIIDPDAKRAHRIKFGEKRRQITGTLKKAKQARKAKDYKAAIALYQEAKKGFAGLMAEAKKIPDRETGAYNKAYRKGSTYAKTGLINWCITKMGECDNAIEAIRNGIMKSERKAAAKAQEGYYLDDVEEFESVIESLGYEDDDDDDFDDYDDDYDEYGDSSLESLMM